MSDLISVIIPVYNVEPYLRQCLDSVVNQTYRCLEIILVDDGSPDNCGAICDEYAARDERVRVIHQENRGVSTARNAGLDVSSGGYILFVDGDDWLERDCCERVLEAAEDQQCDIVFFQRQEDDVKGRPVRRYPGRESYALDKEMLHQMQIDLVSEATGLCCFSVGAPWARLFRSRLLTDNHCRFTEGIKRKQDVLFNILCLEYLESAYYLNYVGYHYRNNPVSICHRYNPEMLDIILSFFHAEEQFLRERHQGEPDYERAFGVSALRNDREIRTTQFFHPDGFMPYREYLPCMQRYRDDPVVSEYLEKCSLSDFRTVRDKIRYMLILNRKYRIYYCLSAAWHKAKMILSGPLNRIRILRCGAVSAKDPGVS